MFFKVKCVKNEREENKKSFTVGKIYEVIDGKIKDNTGFIFKSWSINGESFDELKKWFEDTKVYFKLVRDENELDCEFEEEILPIGTKVVIKSKTCRYKKYNTFDELVNSHYITDDEIKSQIKNGYAVIIGKTKDKYVLGSEECSTRNLYLRSDFDLYVEPKQQKKEEIGVVFVGDILELKEDKFGFKKGEKFEVTGISDMITIKSQKGVGGMSFEELKYFKVLKVEEEWSEWFFWVLSFGCCCRYRVKGKLIQVRDSLGREAYAKCLDCDEFDLEKGIRIALLKIKIQEFNHDINEAQSQKQKHIEELNKLTR